MKIFLFIILGLASLQACAQEKEKDVAAQTVSLQLHGWSMISISASVSGSTLQIQSPKSWVSKKTRMDAAEIPKNKMGELSSYLNPSVSKQPKQEPAITFYTVSPE